MQNSKRALILVVIAGLFVCACTAVLGTAGFVAWRIVDDAEQLDAPGVSSEVEADEQQDSDTEMAPAFSVTDLDGHTWTLDELEGRPVVINFWATWCPQCREELPALQKLADEYAEDGLVILLSGKN